MLRSLGQLQYGTPRWLRVTGRLAVLARGAGRVRSLAVGWAGLRPASRSLASGATVFATAGGLVGREPGPLVPGPLQRPHNNLYSCLGCNHASCHRLTGVRRPRDIASFFELEFKSLYFSRFPSRLTYPAGPAGHENY